MRRGPRANVRRHRAASHINAIESGPRQTARTIAGTPFQSANRRFACCAEIGELSSSDPVATSRPQSGHPARRRALTLAHALADHALALNPLLLTIHSRFDAA